MSHALDGMRVLEITQALAGPYCGMLLADMGAEVIKIEDPKRGLQTRNFGPMSYAGGVNASYVAVNRSKKSVVLDLKSPAGRELFLQLVETANVVLENNRPGVMERLGLGWDTLRQANPGLIFASISGFGQTGPYRDRGGYDLIAQGMSGIMSVTGEPGEAPAKAGIPITDLGAALFCTYAILAAYVHFLKTGRGQRVDTSLWEAGVALSVWEATEYWSTGRVPQPLGSAHRMNAPYQVIKASDGYFTIGANNEKLWSLFCREVIGRPELERDRRFATKPDRLRNRRPLIREIEAMTVTRPKEYWLKRCEAAGVPSGPIYTYDEVFSDPQTEARSMIQRFQHPLAGTLQSLGIPVKLDLTPGRAAVAPSEFGQDTEAVLLSLGVSAERLARLREQGVIQVPAERTT